MTVADVVYEVVRPPENSQLTLKHFIKCAGGIVPAWVEHCAKPFDGEIPDGRPVFDVDLRAEMAERAAAEAAFQQDDRKRVTNAELMRDRGWSVADYVAARDIYGLPPSDAIRQTGSDLFGSGGGEPVRLQSSIDRWAEEWRQKLPVITRLVGDKEKSGVARFFGKR